MGLGRFWAVIGVALLAPGVGSCGICSDVVQGPRHDIQLFAGYSPDSPTFLGSAPDRQFAVAGLSYGYRCWTPGSVSVFYNATVMPAAILINSHAVYGFAVAPLGFTVEFSRRRVRPFFETIEGIIASTEPIPIRAPNATGLNFLFDLGGGIRWNMGPRRAISVGYRFLHISNAGTTNFNPGVDNNVIYVGYSFLR
jgi:hypothetical protein